MYKKLYNNSIITCQIFYFEWIPIYYEIIINVFLNWSAISTLASCDFRVKYWIYDYVVAISLREIFNRVKCPKSD